jgi:hypothetical protein
MKFHGFAKSSPLLLAAFLLTGLVLTGCASGGIASLGIPQNSPWNFFTTFLNSTQGDVRVFTTGSGLSATLNPQGQAAVCTSDQGGFFAACSSPGCTSPTPAEECAAQAPSGATNVGFGGKLPFGYELNVNIDRSTFTLGGLTFFSPTVGTVGAIGLSLNADSKLNLSAGFSNNLIPGPTAVQGQGTGSPLETAAVFDDFAGVDFAPQWPDFGPGFVCTDTSTTSCDPATSFDRVLALCDTANGGDVILFRTNSTIPPGPAATLKCGSVTFNFGSNPPFTSRGDCMSTLFFQNCFGLTGQNRSGCVRAQGFVCQSLFAK